MDGTELQILNTLRTMLELGWPAIVLIMLYVMWNEYRRVTKEYIEALREVAGLKQQLSARSSPPAQPMPAPRITDTGELKKNG